MRWLSDSRNCEFGHLEVDGLRGFANPVRFRGLPGLIDAPFRDADRSSSPHRTPIIQTVQTNVAGVADERAMERSGSGF
jgi:hypothetical protein